MTKHLIFEVGKSVALELKIEKRYKAIKRTTLYQRYRVLVQAEHFKLVWRERYIMFLTSSFQFITSNQKAINEMNEVQTEGQENSTAKNSY